MTTIEQTESQTPWHGQSAAAATHALGVDPGRGLDPEQVERRLREHGPKEPSPSVWTVARGQASNPMNIMLLIVAVASFAIGQVPTGLFVLGLVIFTW